MRIKLLHVIIVIGLLIALLAIVAGYLRTPKLSGSTLIKGELWINVSEGIDENETKEMLNDYNLSIIYHSNHNPVLYKIQVPEGEEEYYMEILRNDPKIVIVERVNGPIT